jgi:hypothetical protein
MPPSPRKPQDMLQGTLDVLILQTLIAGPAHGHTIAHVIETSCRSSTARSIRPCTGSKIAAGLPPSGGRPRTIARRATTG